MKFEIIIGLRVRGICLFVTPAIQNNGTKDQSQEIKSFEEYIKQERLTVSPLEATLRADEQDNDNGYRDDPVHGYRDKVKPLSIHSR